MKLVTSSEMRGIEAEAVKRGADLARVMELAGAQVARVVSALPCQGSVLILAGPGNNGGDGLVTARVLAATGRPVEIYTFGRDDSAPDGSTIRSEDDPNRVILRQLVGRAAVIVDALLGTGQTRAVTGALASIVSTVNDRPARAQVTAIDVPTGVDATTGAVLGTGVHGDVTVCISSPKLGVMIGDGRSLAGRVTVADVGLPADLVPAAAPNVLDVADAARLFPPRPFDSNKGTFGRVLVIAGSRPYLGAPALVAAAGLRTGVGLIELVAIDDVRRAVAGRVPEAIYVPVPEDGGQISGAATTAIADAIGRADAIAIGPGLGRGPAVETVVLAALAAARGKPAVVDADALNALSCVTSWWERLPYNSVITPHPGEMARLTGEPIDAIQRDRLAVAARYAERWTTTVLLKGRATVIAARDGTLAINPTGAPNLATGGTGDVLTGTIAGLLAQGVASHDAALLGAYWHGAVGDIAAASDGLAGTLAGDLPRLLPGARELILRQGGMR